MNSSGKKRGLAVAATAALAIAGLPFLAGTATAQTVGGSLGALTFYSQNSTDQSSNRNSGVNSTVGLLVGTPNSIGGEVITSVKFSYRLDGSGDPWQVITQVTPANGVAAYEWAAPEGNWEVKAEALDSFAAIQATVQTDVDVANADVSVDFTHGLREKVGQFDGRAVLSGTTTGDEVDIRATGPSATSGFETTDFGATAGGLTSFRGDIDVTGNNTVDATDDLVIEAFVEELDTPGTDEGTDTQVVELYDQVVTNATIEVAPGFTANVPFGNGVPDTTEYIMSVTDQLGKPIFGVDLLEANENGTVVGGNAPQNNEVTDYDGKGYVSLNEATIDNFGDHNDDPNVQSTYYVVDANNNGVYNNGTDWLLQVTQSNYPQVPATVTINNALAGITDDNITAMDDDETSTLTFTVKDNQGNPVPNENVLVKVNYSHGAAAYVSAGSTNNQGKETESFTPHNIGGPEQGEIVSIDAYVNVDGNPNPTTGDAIAATYKIETGESEVVWDNGTRKQTLANGDTTESGKLQLESGTALVKRTVDLGYTPGNGAPGNAIIAPEVQQAAGVNVVNPTKASAKTGNDGKFSIKLDDPAAPVGQETDSELIADDTIGANGLELGDESELMVDWLRSLTPATMVIRNSNNDNADSLANVFGGSDNLQPGKFGIGYVEARNADGVLLSDAAIPMKIGEGNFVDVSNPDASLFDPAPVVGANIGEWSNVGKTFNYVTGDDFQGPSDSPASFGDDRVPFAVNIERNTGFDDDGLVNDKVNAGTGTASFEHDFKWNTKQSMGGVPLNNGTFTVALDADQESPILPKARAGDYGHTVYYDVVTTDQFGNRTQQSFSVLDNTPVAHNTTSGQSQYTLDDPAIDAWADSATNQELEVELVNQTKSKVTDLPTTSTLSIPASLAMLYTVTPDDIQTTTAAINWYNLDLANSTFTLGQAGAETVAVGSTVNEIANAKDQEGAPIWGLDVVFTRSGPSDEDSDGNIATGTNQSGNATYTFAGGAAGTATTTASFFDNGDIVAQVEDKVEFAGGTGGGVVAINAKLTGSNNGAKADKLKVIAGNVKAAGATVKLYRTTPSGDKLIGTKTLNNKGERGFKVKDRNGKKKTRYYAVVSATDLTKGDRTSSKKVR